MSLLIKEDSLLASEELHFVQKQANKLCRLLQFSKEKKIKAELNELKSGKYVSPWIF